MGIKIDLKLTFPLKKYGYVLKEVLNNENRWDTKIVCSILDKNLYRFVSTTYVKQSDYLGLLEAMTYLNSNNKLSPHIARIYPEDKTIVCDYIGEFLIEYLLKNPADIALILTSVFDYLKDINSLNQSGKRFVSPSIIKSSLQIASEFSEDFEFLPKTKVILSEVEDAGIKFAYGYGIEDPHIWNFRVVETADRIQALTTDFDFFQNAINYFWELGYFYATFRWFKRESPSLATKAERLLLSLVQNQDLKSEFMFWLGVLSSFCGYRDSLLNFIKDGKIAMLPKQHRIIQQLDERVFYLANKLLSFSPAKEVISIK